MEKFRSRKISNLSSEPTVKFLPSDYHNIGRVAWHPGHETSIYIRYHYDESYNITQIIHLVFGLGFRIGIWEGLRVKLGLLQAFAVSEVTDSRSRGEVLEMLVPSYFKKGYA